MSSICVPLLLVSLQDDDWFTETVELDKVCTMTLCSTMAGSLSLLEGRGSGGEFLFDVFRSPAHTHPHIHTFYTINTFYTTSHMHVFYVAVTATTT